MATPDQPDQIKTRTAKTATDERRAFRPSVANGRARPQPDPAPDWPLGPRPSALQSRLLLKVSLGSTLNLHVPALKVSSPRPVEGPDQPTACRRYRVLAYISQGFSSPSPARHWLKHPRLRPLLKGSFSACIAPLIEGFHLAIIEPMGQEEPNPLAEQGKQHRSTAAARQARKMTRVPLIQQLEGNLCHLWHPCRVKTKDGVIRQISSLRDVLNHSIMRGVSCRPPNPVVRVERTSNGGGRGHRRHARKTRHLFVPCPPASGQRRKSPSGRGRQRKGKGWRNRHARSLP